MREGIVWWEGRDAPASRRSNIYATLVSDPFSKHFVKFKHTFQPEPGLNFSIERGALDVHTED